MKIILDTHVFLQALSEPDTIDEKRRYTIESMGNTIYVSAISVAEIMIKASIGKLIVDFDPVQIALDSGFELLDFSGKDAVLLKDLPFHHRDPFDRMLIAQSIASSYPIMSNDHKLSRYDCKIL